MLWLNDSCYKNEQHLPSFHLTLLSQLFFTFLSTVILWCFLAVPAGLPWWLRQSACNMGNFIPGLGNPLEEDLATHSSIFFLIFIFTLFYFTILYWFCHTLTWIRHGCTWVPNHEPSSLFVRFLSGLLSVLNLRQVVIKYFHFQNYWKKCSFIFCLFKKFLFLLYFTILYWFCHTLTWISWLF